MEERKSVYYFPLKEEDVARACVSQVCQNPQSGLAEPVGRDWMRFSGNLRISHIHLSLNSNSTISPSMSSPRLNCLYLTSALVHQPSLQVLSTWRELLSYSNTPVQQLLVLLTRALVARMHSLTMSQIILVFREKQLSTTTLCSVSHCEISILVQLEMVVLQWLDMASLKKMPAIAIIPRSRLHLTATAVVESGPAYQTSCCIPFTDFYESSFPHGLGKDPCLVTWRSDGNNLARGLTVVMVEVAVSDEMELEEPASVHSVSLGGKIGITNFVF